MDNKVISNFLIDNEELLLAKEIILDLQSEMETYIKMGCGPFVACVCDEKGNIVAKCANSVVGEQCSNNHAEVNVIKLAQQKFNTYDLSKYNLSLYVTAEPCIMCVGAIMWSGIKKVFYGVSSKIVEDITGFDEGFKPDWLDEFKKRGILVCGNIEQEAGIKQLKNYMSSGMEVYKPQRN